MFDPSTPITDFLDATAARKPTPGGGSVAALAGALAAAMGEMVLNYSVGRKGLEAHQDELKSAVAEVHKARQVLLQLMVEDQLAFEAFSAARKLPDGSPERNDKWPAALTACIRVPQAMAATAVALLAVCDRVADKVNPYLLSDLAVCADLAMATVRSAVYNVRINLPEVPDADERQRLAKATDEVLGHGLKLIQRVSPRIWQRAGA